MTARPTENSETPKVWPHERLADLRTNTVRIFAVGVFYAIHLLHYLSNHADGSASWIEPLVSFLQLKSDQSIATKVHLAITLIVAGWIVWAVVIQRAVIEVWYPKWVAYISYFLDIVLLTAALSVSTGARSPLVGGYILIIMLATLRLNLSLVRWIAVGCLLGFLITLGAAKWPRGVLKAHQLPSPPRHEQLMIAATICVAGVIAGQWVRQTRSLLEAKMNVPRSGDESAPN